MVATRPIADLNDYFMKQLAFCLSRPGLRVLLASAVFGSSLPSARAHPGHALEDASWTHLATSPDHAALLVLAAAGTLVATRFITSHRWQRILQSCGFGLLSMGILMALR